MSNPFLISDTHFGHANILTFKKKDGTLLRSGFKDITDHDLELVKRWNSVVAPNDKVYHLGDVGRYENRKNDIEEYLSKYA